MMRTVLNLSTLEVVNFDAPNATWLSQLEDILYTMWEITPHNGNSLWGLLNGEHKMFSFHGVAFVEVWLEPRTGRVLVKDLPYGWNQK
jgi:hypothetical protein